MKPFRETLSHVATKVIATIDRAEFGPGGFAKDHDSVDVGVLHAFRFHAGEKTHVDAAFQHGLAVESGGAVNHPHVFLREALVVRLTCPKVQQTDLLTTSTIRNTSER